VKSLARLLALQQANASAVGDAADGRAPSTGAVNDNDLQLAGPTPLIPITTGWEHRDARYAASNLPAEWKCGLLRLSGMLPPIWFGEEVWVQLLDDVDHVALEWGRIAYEAGWSELQLFGCSPEFAGRLDRNGVAMFLGSRPIVACDATSLTIANRVGPANRFYRKEMIGSVPIWAAQARG
jgi:hypothetical protein